MGFTFLQPLFQLKTNELMMCQIRNKKCWRMLSSRFPGVGTLVTPGTPVTVILLLTVVILTLGADLVSAQKVIINIDGGWR